MTHSIRLRANLKGAVAASLDVSDELDDETYQRLSERLTQAASSNILMAEEQTRLRAMLDQLAAKAGATRNELVELYDFQIDIA